MTCNIGAIWQMMSFSGIQLNNVTEMYYNGQENAVYIYDDNKWYKVFIMAELP